MEISNSKQQNCLKIAVGFFISVWHFSSHLLRVDLLCFFSCCCCFFTYLFLHLFILWVITSQTPSIFAPTFQHVHNFTLSLTLLMWWVAVWMFLRSYSHPTVCVAHTETSLHSRSISSWKSTIFYWINTLTVKTKMELKKHNRVIKI